MDTATVPRHQCLIYEGPPSRHLPALAGTVAEKLKQNFRCMYLNSRPMVTGMQSYLAARGVDVARESKNSNLVMVSEQQHLRDGLFDIERMMDTLSNALDRALRDGYQGLWATGDMTWEFGPDRNVEKLVEYEWRLEEFFRSHPQISGVCQYHSDTLPKDTVRKGFLVHPSLFINETLSVLNPHYKGRKTLPVPAWEESGLDAAIRQAWSMNRAD